MKKKVFFGSDKREGKKFITKKKICISSRSKTEKSDVFWGWWSHFVFKDQLLESFSELIFSIQYIITIIKRDFFSVFLKCYI